MQVREVGPRCSTGSLRPWTRWMHLVINVRDDRTTPTNSITLDDVDQEGLKDFEPGSIIKVGTELAIIMDCPVERF